MSLTPDAFRAICIKAQQAALAATASEPEEPPRTSGEAASLWLHLEEHTELVLWLVSQSQVAPEIFCFCQPDGVGHLDFSSVFRLSLAAQHAGYEAALLIFVQEAGIRGEIQDCIFDILPSADWLRKH